MRTYGRINGKWVQVNTDASGDHSHVWLTTLCQTLKLERGESPFWANYGISARQAVASQTFPDLYMAQTQQQFTPYFLSLTLQRISGPTPHYQITATTPKGTLNPTVAIAQ
jgi:hypothetical protein